MKYTNEDLEYAMTYIESILTDVGPDDVGSLTALQLLNNAMGFAIEGLEGLKLEEVA